MSGSHVQSGSSGSDFSSDPLHANVDEKKRKRMISNRESARRSRMKKQKQLEDLVNEVSNIEDQNARLRQSIDLAASRFGEIDSANNVLRSQVAELTDRLRSLNTVLEIVKEVSGFDLEIPEVPDLLLKPWQLPCPVQPIAASSAIADVSQY